ncbi:MAG: glycosyltransferase family 2 protein [Gemmatimonadaceae bacterium]|nr:glycosyltransferase family 2 protein [Gemmatimonadaceae bacterium]
MASGLPSFTVVIPTFNYAQFVGKAIRSALRQTHAPVQVIVVDDGSTDDTPDVLAGFGGSITVIRRSRGGPGAARNAALEIARGECVAFLDSDDFWSPVKLERQGAAALRYPAVTMFGCGATVVDERGTMVDIRTVPTTTSLGAQSVEDLLLFRARTPTSGVVVRTETLRAVGGFDAQLEYCEDWEAWMRVAARGGLHIVGEPLVYVREHRSGTFRNADRLKRGMLAALAKAEVLHGFSRITRRRARANVWEHVAYEHEIARDPDAARDAFRRAALLWPLDWRFVLKAFRPLRHVDAAHYGGAAS